MTEAEDRQAGTEEPEPYQPTSKRVQQEVGGILEHAFRREDGQEPFEQEIEGFLSLAEEAEARAEAAQSLAREAELAALEAADRYVLTDRGDDLAELEYFQAKVEAYRREAETMRLEAERLRKYLPG